MTDMPDTRTAEPLSDAELAVERGRHLVSYHTVRGTLGDVRGYCRCGLSGGLGQKFECPTARLLATIDAIRATRATPATGTEGLDVERVKQAVTNIAVRHGVVKDPPPPSWSLMHFYGYSAATADMEAEIAREYAALGTPQ